MQLQFYTLTKYLVVMNIIKKAYVLGTHCIAVYEY